MRSVLQTPQPLVMMLFAGLASAPTFASKGLGDFLFFFFSFALFQLTNFMGMWWDAMVGLRSLPSSFLFARCGNSGSLGLWSWLQYRRVHTEQCSTELREIFRTGYKQDTSLHYGMIGNLRMMWYFAAEMFERFTVRYFSQCCSAGSPTQLCGELEIKVRRAFLFFLSLLLLRENSERIFSIHPLSILPYRPSFPIVLVPYFAINKRILCKDGLAQAKTRLRVCIVICA